MESSLRQRHQPQDLMSMRTSPQAKREQRPAPIQVAHGRADRSVSEPEDPLALSPRTTETECAVSPTAAQDAGCSAKQWSSRGVFLLVMACTVFGAFVAGQLAEMTRYHPTLYVPSTWQVFVATWTVRFYIVAIPVTNLAAWTPSCWAAQVASHQVAGQSGSSPNKCEQEEVEGHSISLVQAIWRRFEDHPNFTIYQAVAWSLYALVLASAWAASHPGPHGSWLPLLDAPALGVAAFIAQVLVISSTLTLEERRDRNRESRRERLVVLLNNYINMLLVIGAVMLAIGSEYTTHYGGEAARYSLTAGAGSLLLFITALMNTYGLGGLLSTKDGWRFYQPFTGGAKFMFLQAISWTCFGTGIFIQGLYLLSIVIVELELFVGAMVLAGSLFLLSEVLMMISLLVFRKSDDEAAHSPTEQHKKSIRDYLEAWTEECLGALLVGVLANLHWVPCAFFYMFFALLTPMSMYQVLIYGSASTIVQTLMAVARGMTTHWYMRDSSYGQKRHVSPYAMKYLLPQLMITSVPGLTTYIHYSRGLHATPALAIVSLYLYGYMFSYRGTPQVTGERMRPNWVHGYSRIMETVYSYFDGHIIRAAPLDPKQHYIMCFHPHGIMTISAMWLQFTEQWRALFPGVNAHILTASILHQIPLVRDVLQFYGSREVTRQAFKGTLEEKESVLLVPGGQAEMLHQRSGQRETRVYTGHKGFIRLAVESGVPLVPILSFKEGETMDNVNMPMVQKWFVKKLAVPFPYFPYGRGYLPIPRKVQIPIVVGEPIPVEKKSNPSPEDIECVHRQYFQALQDLFEKYKDEAGCSDYKLVLI